MSNEQEMKSNHFFELCQALPEGVNWIDPITPQIADAIWQAATLAAEARIREVCMKVAFHSAKFGAMHGVGINMNGLDSDDLEAVVNSVLEGKS